MVLSEATINATLYSPDQAAGIGYLDEAVDADQLDAASQAAAERLAALDSAAFALTKSKVRQPTIDRIRALSGSRLRFSVDLSAGLARA